MFQKKKFKFFIILIYSIICSHSYGNEVLNKAMKCETDRKTIRGYPFYFFFEKSTNVQNYFIQDQKIKFFNHNYTEIKPNIFEIRYVGEINKNNLILTHFKGRRIYNCIFLLSKNQISKELKNFIKSGVN